MRLLYCRRGLAATEFALLLPILVTLLVGTIEFSRYALMHLKTDKTAHAMADLLTQSRSVTYADMQGFAENARQIIQPYEFEGSIIFTAITFRDVGRPPCIGMSYACVAWQYRPVGTHPSKLGRMGGRAYLPGGYSVPLDQVVIGAEVYMHYVPMLGITATLVPRLKPHYIYKVAIYKPRQTGTLMMIPPPGDSGDPLPL